MKFWNTYWIGYHWNRIEFLNSNQFTESKNIEIWLSKVKKDIFLVIVKFIQRKNLFLAIICPIFNIFQFCKLFWTQVFKLVQWIPMLLRLSNFSFSLTLVIFFIIKPHLRGIFLNFVKNLFYNHALEFQVEYYF